MFWFCAGAAFCMELPLGVVSVVDGVVIVGVVVVGVVVVGVIGVVVVVVVVGFVVVGVVVDGVPFGAPVDGVVPVHDAWLPVGVEPSG